MPWAKELINIVITIHMGLFEDFSGSLVARMLNYQFQISQIIVLTRKIPNFEKNSFLFQLVGFADLTYSVEKNITFTSPTKPNQLLSLKSILFDWLASGCCTAVGRTHLNREVVGSNPARCWDFFSYLSSK